MDQYGSKHLLYRLKVKGRPMLCKTNQHPISSGRIQIARIRRSQQHSGGMDSAVKSAAPFHQRQNWKILPRREPSVRPNCLSMRNARYTSRLFAALPVQSLRGRLLQSTALQDRDLAPSGHVTWKLEKAASISTWPSTKQIRFRSHDMYNSVQGCTRLPSQADHRFIHITGDPGRITNKESLSDDKQHNVSHQHQQ